MQVALLAYKVVVNEQKKPLSSYHTDGFESRLNLSCSKLQAVYECRTVIRLDRDYLPNIERFYEFNHHRASNQIRVFTKAVA